MGLLVLFSSMPPGQTTNERANMKTNTETMRLAIARAMSHKPRRSWQSRIETGLVWTLFAAVLLCAAMVGFCAAAMVAAAIR